jgi:hypothetical protein
MSGNQKVKIKSKRQERAMPAYILTDPAGNEWQTFERAFREPPLWWMKFAIEQCRLRESVPPIGWHLFTPQDEYVGTFRRLYEVKAKVAELYLEAAAQENVTQKADG